MIPFRKLGIGVIGMVVLLMATGMQPAGAVEKSDEVSLNFVNADIDSVLQAVSKITNRNFLVDPRVRGSISIVTSRPVSPALAYQILLSALRLQGFAAVEENGIVKVMPEADVKLHSVPVSTAKSRLHGDQPITQVFSIKNESAAQLYKVVRPLVSPNNTVTEYENSNTLIVTDYADNVERIGRIIDAIDIPHGDAVSIPIRYASVLDVAAVISRSMSEKAGSGSGGDDSAPRVSIVPDTRLNQLLVRSDNLSRINAVRQLVAILDQPGVEGNIHVIYLKNAVAGTLAQTLRAVLSGEAGNGPGGDGAAAGLSAAKSSIAGAQSQAGSPGSLLAGGGIVQADLDTNALIITAPEAIYKNIRRVVDMLDRRRMQVYVEALIAEVNSDHAAEFGIQLKSANIPTISSGSSATVFGGTNFNAGGSNIQGLAANPGNAPPGLNVEVGKGTITLPGSTTPILNLTMLARFLESQTHTNILSTPNLVVLDNEEAKIVVGQNLPFITGQYTNTSGSSTPANPFQTIERHDVGLTLRIRPQISEGGLLRLQINEESSTVVATSLNSATGPITNKRSIETVALVDDGAIIALGGLVQDSYTSGTDQVPVLGDLPIVGNLFKYNTRGRTKTNLFIFLRPKILRDAESYQSLASERYEYVIGQQRASDRSSNKSPHDSAVPELPALPPAAKIAPTGGGATNPGVAPSQDAQ